ncbi:hypothetical protein R1flu_018120 [Riccia fluitans]|uniref:Uncharacterized protein n=1 Tax=Riccia fluitans TaxID=41844 RepID=A0ABD1ZF53_9MARC
MEAMRSVGMAGVLLQTGLEPPSSLASASSDMRVSKVRTSKGMALARRSRGRWSLGIISESKDEDEGGPRKDQGESPKVDWDKAWTNYSGPQKKKKSFFSIDMEQYVSRRPERSDYPLSEEVDPLRKTERSALGVWSSPQFFYVLIGIIVLLLIYMVVIVGPPPSR